jgi:predicted negative regulator of RcsB-dependent stress response
MEWAEIADLNGAEGKIHRAIKVYRTRLKQGTVSDEQLVKWGDLAMRHGKYEGAIKAYALAKAIKKLRALHQHLHDGVNPRLAQQTSAEIVILESAR